MTTWFTSDTHFNHANIIKYCNRPWDTVEEMNEGLIERWNEVVKPRHRIFHLGDFCMGGTEPKDWIPRLNGKIHLIRGNHDPYVVNQGFESVQDYKEIKISKKKLILFHYPMRVWNKSHYGSWHLFGHVHGAMTVKYGTKTLPDCLAIDVGSDCHDWRPISFDEIAEIMNKHTEKLKQDLQSEIDKGTFSGGELEFKKKVLNSL